MIPFALNNEFITDAVKCYLAGNSIYVNHADGTQSVYSYIDSSTAKIFYQGVLNSQTGSTGFFLGGISPASFDITTDTITVYGANFPIGFNLRLHVEDTSGGLDNNGYYMLVTVYTANTASAVLSASGDAGLSPQMLLYLTDTNNANYSNVLVGRNPSGTIIAYP